MRGLWLALALICASSTGARAEGERAGDFDYYVMALSWSANWCAQTGDARRDPQCDRGRGTPFVLHGLWPQNERGWPSYCRTGAADPSRSDTAAMADVFGGAGAAFYQWKKHGRCSGLPARDYYALARKAFGSIQISPVFPKITKDLKVPASVIEGAFLEANPGLQRDQVTVTCRAGMIQEVRICLTRDLDPRRCGADVIRDCTLQDAELNAVR
ncbi:ribonuclease T2 family protein [Pseudotabrizicola alkalilacus]|uniref:Ribonuclease T n=1 Tax=Pseudotabrizicola alkalilacus TaxID=2305252 RepID=A0A411Z587_9RHOB|nr:ribonuclease T2 [Pseudotabrizicola alkalilacus]RGP38182.1 ribonuclease T [Pseudotabrizicola alkalilacus]